MDIFDVVRPEGLYLCRPWPARVRASVRCPGDAGNKRLHARWSLLLQMVRPDGFEPPTTAFEAQYSIQLSYGRPGT